jgi:hypothetical protein
MVVVHAGIDGSDYDGSIAGTETGPRLPRLDFPESPELIAEPVRVVRRAGGVDAPDEIWLDELDLCVEAEQSGDVVDADARRQLEMFDVEEVQPSDQSSPQRHAPDRAHGLGDFVA